MSKRKESQKLFHKYFKNWVVLYKEGAVRDVTLQKYAMTYQRLVELAPDLRICELNRTTYQKLLNDYAKTHEKQTTTDFHHQIKGAILDAIDDGLLTRDPTRKAVIKGRTPTIKKQKFLNQFELQALLAHLDLTEVISWDWFILVAAKTGCRFSEILGLTPNDFDFSAQTVSINKTWHYKTEVGEFQPTKNQSSIRKIQLDWQISMQLSQMIRNLPQDAPFFVEGRVFNSTVNHRLKKHCLAVNLPVISIHGLRHTHASLLLFAGVSIASVARRLGHSNMTATQQTYLHIIHELENQDNDKMMRCLASLR